MEPWSPLKIPSFCERLIGFSVPVNGRSLAISYEGVHLLQLDETVTVQTDDLDVEDLDVEDYIYDPYYLYDPETGLAKHGGVDYRVLGLHGGKPLLQSPQGEHLELNVAEQTISIFAGERCMFRTPYENFSGDWVAATFSPDGMFLLLGCPYDFDFRVWRRPTAR